MLYLQALVDQCWSYARCITLHESLSDRAWPNTTSSLSSAVPFSPVQTSKLLFYAHIICHVVLQCN